MLRRILPYISSRRLPRFLSRTHLESIPSSSSGSGNPSVKPNLLLLIANYSPVHLNFKRSFSTISPSIFSSRGKSHLQLTHRPPRNSRRLLVRNGIECAPSSGVSDSRTALNQKWLTVGVSGTYSAAPRGV